MTCASASFAATNPEAPIIIEGNPRSPDEPGCALWNPSAATGWSLVFTPAFGAFIHMLNWHALGQPEQAASARRWLYASLAVLMLQICTRALNVRLGTELLLHPALALVALT